MAGWVMESELDFSLYPQLRWSCRFITLSPRYIGASTLFPTSPFSIFDKFEIKRFCSWQDERPSSSAFCTLLASECKN